MRRNDWCVTSEVRLMARGQASGRASPTYLDHLAETKVSEVHPPVDADLPDSIDQETLALGESIDAWCIRRLASLQATAEQVHLCLQERLVEQAQVNNRPLGRGGRIGVRIRRQTGARATPGAFSVEWIFMRTTTTKDKRHFTTSEYLAKGSGDRYPSSAFAGYVRDWQREIVRDAEEAFASIRQRARLITETRTQFRAAERQFAKPPRC